MRLCVIGAGAAGLCAIKNGIDFGCEVTAFEKTDVVGGTWVYTDEIGKDKNGLDVHSSMYQKLRTNSPKEIMGYPTVPFHKQDQSYVTSEAVCQYFRMYADIFTLDKCIKFEHNVLRVRPLQDQDWEVIVQDMRSKKFATYLFDAILVCNGHYSTPQWPKYRGQNLFEGKQIHSHEYRKSDEFRGESVLLIGAGPSGIDISRNISEVAKNVTWSHHLVNAPATHFSDNVNQRVDVKELTKNGVLFVDASYQEYTVIIYCTGYKYTFPFLSVDCGVKCDNNFIRPLYKHCLSINNSSLGLIGLPNMVCPNQMFDLQVRFCLTFMCGRKNLPTKEEMLRDLKNDMKERRSRCVHKNKAHYMGQDIHDVYYSELARAADIEPILSVISKIFKSGYQHYLRDSTNFRNDVFKIIDSENFVVCNQQQK